MGVKVLKLFAPVEDADGIVLREGPLFLLDSKYTERNIPNSLLKERLDEIKKMKHDQRSYEEITFEILEKYKDLN